MPKINLEVFNTKNPGYSIMEAAKAAFYLGFDLRRETRLSKEQRELYERAHITKVEVGDQTVQQYIWNPEGREKAFLVHGFGGRCLDFEAIIPTLVKQNFKVIGFDAIGHGFSTGEMPDIGVFWPCIQEIAKREGKDFKLCISHSFGSAALTYQIRQGSIHTENLIMFSPNAHYDSCILGFFKLMNISHEVYKPLRELIVNKFADRVDESTVWSAGSTLENLSQQYIGASIKKSRIFYGAKDNMFPVTDSTAIASANPHINPVLSEHDCGHREILFDQEVLASLESFCHTLVSEPGYTQTADVRFWDLPKTSGSSSSSSRVEFADDVNGATSSAESKLPYKLPSKL